MNRMGDLGEEMMNIYACFGFEFEFEAINDV